MFLTYSDIKIKLRHILLNSKVNPETNSDYRSEKPRGEQFISAKNLINDKILIKKINIINLIYLYKRPKAQITLINIHTTNFKQNNNN